MTQSRTVGIMVDNKEIERNLVQMADSIRNANYKMLEANHIQPNEDGEYIDAEGDNLLMSEEDVLSVLRDAIDNHLVAAIPGSKNHNPQDFQYYLLDSFPNVAEQIQSNPAVANYLSALFASTCGTLSSTLGPAIQDIVQCNQNVESIDVFNLGANNSYYVLKGEQDTTDNNPEHTNPKLSNEDRQNKTKAELIMELGPERYAQYERDQTAVKIAERLNEQPIDNRSWAQKVGDAAEEQLKQKGNVVRSRYYSSSVDDGTPNKQFSHDFTIHYVNGSTNQKETVVLHEPLLFPNT